MVISSSFCLGTNDFSECSTLSEVAEPDDWRETDDVWDDIAVWDADATPTDDEASWAENFWYLCATTENHILSACGTMKNFGNVLCTSYQIKYTQTPINTDTIPSPSPSMSTSMGFCVRVALYR